MTLISTFGVLGPVSAERDGAALDLKGPRHRAVLARLIIARRRVVPVATLVEDLWDEPPPRAVGAVRTFVADLRKVIEPERAPREPARLLVTVGSGYALRAAPDSVDAWRFETAVANAQALDAALALWRGPAYADFPQENWCRAERSRLTELRLRAIELRAEALLAEDRAADVVPDLDAHLAEHPWREDAWGLLVLALYRTGRQADALAVLRRARTMLIEHLGVDPGPRLRRLETDILTQAPRLDQPAARLWAEATQAYDQAAGARARLESTVGLLRDLAVTGGGGLVAARRHRLAAVLAAEELGDPVLTARVTGAYDVPASWTRGDDPEQARQVVAAAERTLAALPAGHPAARCRLLATIAVETRGVRGTRAPEAAREALEIARALDDPALLAFALNGVFMQSCTSAGLAPRRDAIGAELVALATRHDLVTYQVLGHLIRLQARGALGDFATADEHATAADRLGEQHELPLVAVFTEWFRAMRAGSAAAYRAAARCLDGAGMPGLEQGLLQLALLCLRLTHRQPPEVDLQQDWGPYRPWAEPFALLAAGDTARAHAALLALPEPPPDLMYEALCCLEAAAALELDDRDVLARTHARLLPAAGELAGAGSGLLTLGPVDHWLALPTRRQLPT